MYTFDARVRYSETDPSGLLTVTGVMNYLQDCSIFQSEDLGLGIAHLKEVSRAWWLHSWQVEILRYPCLGEKITVGTWPYGFKGIYGYRNFVMLDGQGDYLVKADSCWLFYNLDRRRPARVEDQDIRGYGETKDRLDMGPMPDKILVPDSLTDGGRMTVLPHHIDSNHHVNNAQYVEIGKAVLPPGARIGRLHVVYKQAAVLGDQIQRNYYKDQQDNYTVFLTDGHEKVFASLCMTLDEGKGLL